jgi:hypothetical protein
VETAELDEMALKAFDVLPKASRPKGKLLERSGYQRMTEFLPLSTAAAKLWSVKHGFVTYARLEGFYRPLNFQASQSFGVTKVRYDNYYCLITEFEQPDGCITKATHDYRSFQPLSISDPNGNVQEGLYNGFGQMLASSFHRNSGNELVGFKPVAEYKRPAFDNPTDAIKREKDALQDTASTIFYAPLSWMGRISDVALADKHWLKRCVTHHDLLPTGHIRASARTRLSDLAPLSVDDVKLKSELTASIREPVHMAVLIADRFPGDDQKHIRITVTDLDGFGRTLQHKQKVTEQSWRVSERVEYNNKGLPIRIYRPWFCDKHRYIEDAFLRNSSPHDKQFYDPLGRLAYTRQAEQNGVSCMRRYTRHPWYTVYEDENDTLEEILPKPTSTTGGEA